MYNTDVKVSNGFSYIQSYNLRAGRGNDFNRGSFMHLLRWFPTEKLMKVEITIRVLDTDFFFSYIF